jgi:hypothetical protein
MAPSPEEKKEFLGYLRIGKDPAEAARMVNDTYTGSTFKRMTRESHPNYDLEFAADYLRARAEGQEYLPKTSRAAQPSTRTLSGHVKAHYLTDDMLAEFCEQVELGVPMSEAAERLEPKTSLTQILRRTNRDSEFANRLAEAKTIGYPVLQDRLRARAIQMAMGGDYRALRDQLIVHVPEFKKLLTTRHEISGPEGQAIKLLAQQALPELPPEKLDELIEYYERRQLPPGTEAA